MTTIVYGELVIYSIILNIIMYCYLNNKSKVGNDSTIFFKRILIAIIFVSTMELIIGMELNVSEEIQNTVYYGINVLFFASNSIIAVCGLSYLDYKIFGDKIKSQKRLIIYLIPTYIDIALVGYNHFNRGFMFDVTKGNHRGIGATISSIILCSFTVIVILQFNRHRSLHEGSIAKTIAKIIIIPITGAILQIAVYDVILETAACTLAAFVTLLLVEKDEMTRDSLTGLYTRIHFENRLVYKLKSKSHFSAIMIDLDHFKEINDTYGHIEGDRVLQKVARILRQNIQSEDMAYRYGGDEFFLLIERNSESVGSLIRRIDESIKKENSLSKHQYKINLSYGYECIDYTEEIRLNELLIRIDKRMYEHKASKMNL